MSHEIEVGDLVRISTNAGMAFVSRYRTIGLIPGPHLVYEIINYYQVTKSDSDDMQRGNTVPYAKVLVNVNQNTQKHSHAHTCIRREIPLWHLVKVGQESIGQYR